MASRGRPNSWRRCPMRRHRPDRLADVQARVPLGCRVRLNAEYRAVRSRSAHKTWRVLGYTVDGESVCVVAEEGDETPRAMCMDFLEVTPDAGLRGPHRDAAHLINSGGERDDTAGVPHQRSAHRGVRGGQGAVCPHNREVARPAGSASPGSVRAAAGARREHQTAERGEPCRAGAARAGARLLRREREREPA
jgi:hypothetical protein